MPAPPLSEKAAAQPPKPRAKISNNQIAPTVEWSPDEGGGGNREERKILSPALKPIFFSHLEEEVEKEVRRDEKEALPMEDALSTLSPLTLEDSWTGTSRDSPSWPARRQLVNGHAEGLVAEDVSEGSYLDNDETEVAKSALAPDSPPPYLMSTPAWGGGGGEGGDGLSAERPLNLAGDGLQGPVEMLALSRGSEESETPPIVTTPTAQALLSRESGPKHRTLTLPISPLVASKKSLNDVDHFDLEQQEVAGEYEDHYPMLQESSLGQVLAVSPAPRDQRISFSAHTGSKLALSDATGRAQDYSSISRGVEEASSRGREQSASQSQFPESNVSRRTGGRVAEASLRTVEPLKVDCEAVTRMGSGLDGQPPATGSKCETVLQIGSVKPLSSAVAVAPGRGKRWSLQDEKVLVSRDGGRPLLGTNKEKSLIVTDLEEAIGEEGGSMIVRKTAGDNSSEGHAVMKEGRNAEPPAREREKGRERTKKPRTLPELKKKSKKNPSKEKMSVEGAQESPVKPQRLGQTHNRVNSQEHREERALDSVARITGGKEARATDTAGQNTTTQSLRKARATVADGDSSLKASDLMASNLDPRGGWPPEAREDTALVSNASSHPRERTRAGASGGTRTPSSVTAEGSAGGEPSRVAGDVVGKLRSFDCWLA